MDLFERLTGKDLQKAAEEVAQEDPGKVLPDLIGMLDNKVVRSHVSFALAVIAQEHPQSTEILKAIPRLIGMLADESDAVRGNACFTFLMIAQYNPGNEDIPKAIPGLVKLLQDKDHSVRKNAAGTLSEFLD